MSGWVSQVTLENVQAAEIILCKPFCDPHSLECHSLGKIKIPALGGMWSSPNSAHQQFPCENISVLSSMWLFVERDLARVGEYGGMSSYGYVVVELPLG